MAKKLNNPETPREEINETKRDLEEFKSIEGIDLSKDKKIQGKMMSENEKAIMRRYNILGSNGKVNLMDLAENLLDFNYNNSGDRTSWKNLWRNPNYVACTQVVLNLFNKKCEVTGNYDKATQTAAEELIKRYRKDPSFKLASDGTVPSGAKNVIVNALLYPDGKKTKETTNKDEIGATTRYAFYRTSYDANSGIITTSGAEVGGLHAGKIYPAWTHGSGAVTGGFIDQNDNEER